MSKLIHLPNISRDLEDKMINSGISTPEILREKGSRNVFVKIKLNNSSADYKMLLALEGAIQGILAEELKESDVIELKMFMEIFNR